MSDGVVHSAITTQRRTGRWRWLTPLKALAAVAVAIAIAGSWLVFPYVVRDADLLQNAGDTTRMLKGAQVSRYLSRELVRHPDLELAATFATDEFFQYVDDTSAIAGVRADQHFIFFVTETVHTGRLPADPPSVALLVGDVSFEPAATSAPVRADHHRVSMFAFARADLDGAPIDIVSPGNVRLAVTNTYFGDERARTFLGMWLAPYAVPDDVASGAPISLAMMLALGAGLLSAVLTPCLLQMMVVFASITAGFATAPQPAGAAATTAPTSADAGVQRKLMFTAVAFVIGFTLLYVLAGALIGQIGHAAQLVFAQYRAPVSAAAGVLVLALAAWMLARGAPALVCRVPPSRLSAVTSRRDAIASVAAAIGVALGCTVCFGGAIVGTLIVYVGAIGDPLIGAGIMLVFSLGFAAPLLASAYWLSRSDSFLSVLQRYRRPVSIVSSAVVAAFGVILITDNFHVVSDFIYPYLRLD